MSEAKVELGRRLFYDKRLSGNRTQACASCHQQALAFTDGRTTALGSTGDHHFRSSPGLANAGYAGVLTWANPDATLLEAQAIGPLERTDPVELGIGDRIDELLARLAADERYQSEFQGAYPQDLAPITLPNTLKAIASFERTLISGDASYDRYTRGDATALTESAKRGMDLFTGDRLACAQCHSGPGFSAAFFSSPSPHEAFRNNGLDGAYPKKDQGLFDITGRKEDMGRFRVPSLRNVGVTAPYMHDGSLPTLEAVVDHYAKGGAGHPNQDPLVKGFTINDTEKADLIAFLNALTDETFLHDPRFADPGP